MPSLKELFSVSSDNSLKNSQKIPIIVSSVGSVLAAISFLASKGAAGISEATISLAIGLTFSSDRISKFELENKIEREFSRISMSIANFEYLGDSESGARWFIRHSKDLEMVHNTVFNRTDRREQPGVAVIRADIKSAMKEAINNNCSWTDIYINKEERAVAELHNELSDEGKDIHTTIKVSSQHPIMQVMIIKYHSRPNNDGSETAVLFGWGVPGSTNSRVYITKDRAAYDYFIDYFQLLARSGTPTRPDPNDQMHLIDLQPTSV